MVYCQTAQIVYSGSSDIVQISPTCGKNNYYGTSYSILQLSMWATATEEETLESKICVKDWCSDRIFTVDDADIGLPRLLSLPEWRDTRVLSLS